MNNYISISDDIIRLIVKAANKKTESGKNKWSQRLIAEMFDVSQGYVCKLRARSNSETPLRVVERKKSGRKPRLSGSELSKLLSVFVLLPDGTYKERKKLLLDKYGIDCSEDMLGWYEVEYEMLIDRMIHKF